ncbi:Aste57867_2693 [Aphanomyces stellatus]|uniref:Aste57867_2693 protein n=1 Tax=Aphanomyces stellatus TaxID=120398 RepID=A0A485KDT9_9STRA|nr:hypothetical protein As57867_002686 [Aphanomyces stellatus]VFT79886.1 Aste57867_2693 [Aphanomyces stellatus]
MSLQCLDRGDPSDADGHVAFLGKLVTCDEASELMNVIYTRHLLFQSSELLRNYCYWGFSADFPSSEDESDFERLEHGTIHPGVEVRPIVIPGVGTEMGLFAIQDLDAGTLLGEYTGVVHVDHGGEFDSYGLAYPSAYENGNMCISAKEYGNVIRCINHSFTNFNSSFTSVLHNKILRMICKTNRHVAAGNQILVNYGESYWKGAGVVPFEWPCG